MAAACRSTCGKTLFCWRRGRLRGKIGVLGDETLDRIAAEFAATDARKDRIFGQTVASRSHAASTFAVSGRSGVQRCFLPFPKQRT